MKKTLFRLMATLISLVIFATSLPVIVGAETDEGIDPDDGSTPDIEIDVEFGDGEVAAESDFEYVINEDGVTVTITKYIGDGGNIIIPSKIAGNKVTAIGESAFYGCVGLICVSVPKNASSIGSAAFGGCKNLTAIKVSENNADYCDIDGVLFSKDKTALIAYSAGGGTEYVIPDHVTDVFDHAFAGCAQLKSVKFLNKDTVIGSNAFNGCTKLKTIYLYKNSTADDFFSNEEYTKVYLNSDGSVPDIEIEIEFEDTDFSPASDFEYVINEDGVTVTITKYIGDDNDVVIPLKIAGCKVTIIGNSAFKNCDSLVSVVIGDTVKSIGDSAFSDCPALASVKVLKKNTSITATAFDNCPNLETIYLYRNSTADKYFNAVDYTKIYLDDEPGEKLTFTVGSAEATAGQSVTVGIAITNNPGFAAFSFKIEYDNAVMTLKSYEWKVLSGGATSFDQNQTKNPVGFSWARPTDFAGNITFLYLTFEIKEDTPMGIYSISISSDDVVANEEKEEIDFVLVSGAITVKDFTPGDLNEDGLINTIDAVLLAQYIAGWEVALNLRAADCNNDGSINSIDAVLLAQYIAGWDVILG